MQEEKYSELEARASVAERDDLLRRAEAHARVRSVIDEMRAEGKALTLSDEEFDLIAAFRRFKLRMQKDGAVFSWQTRKPEDVQLVEDTALIQHPNEG